MALIDELKKYYADLLIVQYQMPKARAEVELYTSVLFPVNQASGNLLVKDISNGFNVDTAVGVQLDIIGIYVGLSRFFLEIQYTDGLYLGLIDYLDDPLDMPEDVTGLTTYDEYDTALGEILDYGDIVSTQGTLPDEDYRTLLKLQIVLNHSNGSRQQISDSLYDFFGNDISVDTGGAVMTMVYFYSRELQRVMGFAIDQGLLPKPAGVRLTAIIVSNTYLALPTYSTPESSLAGLTGLSEYSDFDTKKGGVLTYGDMQQI